MNKTKKLSDNPWEKQIPDTPENVARILMRTPLSEIQRKRRKREKSIKK